MATFHTTSKRGPRKVAETHNDPALFADADDDAERFDAEAGCPRSAAGRRPLRDDAAHATNPPDPPAPCRNLKRDK